MEVKERGRWIAHIRLEKRHGDINALGSPEGRLAFLRDIKPYEVIEREGNCLLNTGINEIWELICGKETTDLFNNSHATIGVGDDDTAAQATDTDLIGSNKTYKAMEVGYPESGSLQKAVFKSSFGDSDANYAWEEWVVKHDTSSICLNRKAESLGTKSGGTWTLEVSITLS